MRPGNIWLRFTVVEQPFLHSLGCWALNPKPETLFKVLGFDWLGAGFRLWLVPSVLQKLRDPRGHAAISSVCGARCSHNFGPAALKHSRVSGVGQTLNFKP